MAVSYADRVKETWTGAGTGTVSLGGAVTGYEQFQDNFSSGNTTHYCIENPGTGEWELGLGTLASGTPWTLARTTVLASSNSNAKVSFSAGQKNVFVDLPASIVSLIQTAVQNTMQVLSGSGLTGGGDLTANRTLALALTSALVTAALGFTPASNAISISAGSGLSGGGNLTANRSLALALTSALVTAALGFTPADETTTISAGSGLSGGGSLAASRTISLALTSALVISALGFTPIGSGDVDTAVAGIAHNAVGSVVFARSAVSLNAGATVAGSNLKAGGISANSSGSTLTDATIDGLTLGGTWRCLGYAPTSSPKFYMSLFKRIS